MAVQEKIYTADEFWELCQLPENADRQLELWEGVVVASTERSAVEAWHTMPAFLDDVISCNGLSLSGRLVFYQGAQIANAFQRPLVFFADRLLNIRFWGCP